MRRDVEPRVRQALERFLRRVGRQLVEYRWANPAAGAGDPTVERLAGYYAVARAALAGDADALAWLRGEGRTARYLVNGEFVYRFERFADAPDPDLTEPLPTTR